MAPASGHVSFKTYWERYLRFPRGAMGLPKRALTAASVDRIKPPSSGQAEYFDKGFPGLALRISYGGGKSFVFFYRIGGKLRRMTLGTYPALSLDDAHEA